MVITRQAHFAPNTSELVVRDKRLPEGIADGGALSRKGGGAGQGCPLEDNIRHTLPGVYRDRKIQKESGRRWKEIRSMCRPVCVPCPRKKRDGLAISGAASTKVLKGDCRGGSGFGDESSDSPRQELLLYNSGNFSRWKTGGGERVKRALSR